MPGSSSSKPEQTRPCDLKETMPKELQRRFPLNKFTVSITLLSLISVEKSPRFRRLSNPVSVFEHSVQAFFYLLVKLWTEIVVRREVRLPLDSRSI